MEQKNNNKIRAEIKFPLILIHTPFGLTFFDKVAKTKVAKAYARFNIYLMPLITALAIFLIVGSLMIMFASAAAREGVRGVGIEANLLIPGLNPYLPITYGWAALIITIVIHEAGHGIVARVYNIRVDSTGIVLILGLPIGAFVNIERDELAKTSLKQKSAILTAGPMNNMILAAASLVALYFVISTLTPLPVDPDSAQFGIFVSSVNGGSLAQSIGLTQGSIIQMVAGQEIRELDELGSVLRQNLGSTVEVVWTDGSGQRITQMATLPEAVEPGGIVLGVSVSPLAPDASVVLDRYKAAFGQSPLALLLPPTMQQAAVPYSDFMAPKYESSVFGSLYAPIANLLFWLWFINFNVGIFNALPIGPLDGGQLYSSVLEKKVKSKTLAKNASSILTYAMVAVVAASIALPHLLS